nr:immunoglobulin light chain junction region [Macaca mulatta]
CIQNIEFPLTF